MKSAVVTGALVFGVGDLLAQNRSKEELNPRNTCIIAALGGVTNGIILPFWFGRLDRVFGKSMIDKRTIACKMASDQVIYAPFAVAIFIYFQAEVCNVESAKRLQRKDQINIWLADCLGTPCPLREHILCNDYACVRCSVAHNERC